MSRRRRCPARVPSARFCRRLLCPWWGDASRNRLSRRRWPYPVHLVDRTYDERRKKIVSRAKLTRWAFILHHNWHLLYFLQHRCHRLRRLPEMPLSVCNFDSCRNFRERNKERHPPPWCCKLFQWNLILLPRKSATVMRTHASDCADTWRRLQKLLESESCTERRLRFDGKWISVCGSLSSWT